jgi:hypothetical protein
VSRLEKKILLWILICAGLLIVVLYSPAGSPNMYSDTSYHVDNTTVRFGGKIQNAPSSKGFAGGNSNSNSNMFASPDFKSTSSLTSSSASISTQSSDLEVSLPVNSIQHKKVNYKVASSSYSAPKNNATYTVQTSSTIENSNKNTSSGSGGAIGGGDINGGVVFSNNNNSNSNNNPIPQNYGFSAITLDLSVFDELTNRQGASNDNPAAVTDPGEDEPVGPPIPVPDGFWFMLLLGISYVVWKLKFKIILFVKSI